MTMTRTERMAGDPLRRDMLTGAVLGFVLILAALGICYHGVRQIGAAQNTQAVLDRADRHVQGAMRGVGELILAEGASEQIKALQSNLAKAGEALKALNAELGNDGLRRHYSEKIAPAWQSMSAMIAPLVSRRSISAADDQVMANYGKLLASMETFESDFAVIESSVSNAITQSTHNTYWLTGGMLGMVLLLFIALNVRLIHRLRRSLGGDLSYAMLTTRNIANGDLTNEVRVDAHDQTSLLYALKSMDENLIRMVTDIRRGAESIRATADEVASGNINLSQRTEEQASTLEETASSMEQLISAVRENTQSASNATSLAKQANQVAARGGAVVGVVVATMNEIQESSRKIGDIIGVIDGITFQTNILALNAAVEAARAGEQGRGFAVVASEVRSLAQRSAEAAKQIKGLIGASVDRVEIGTRQVEDAGKTMVDIERAVEQVTAMIERISAASNEQASGIEQVNSAVSQMEQAVQQNAAVVEQAAAAAESMRDNAQQLYEAVGAFKLAEAQASDDAAMPGAARNSPGSAAATSRSGAQSAASMRIARETPSRLPRSETRNADWKEF